MNPKTKIKKHYENNFSSSPVQISDEEVEFIIQKNYECDNCVRTIFEMDDFPEIDIERDELLCEECYYYYYKKTCTLCGDYYYDKDLPTEFPRDPIYYIGTENKSGIYHALEYPMFYAPIGGLGDTIILWDNLEYICSMEEFLAVNDPESNYEIRENWQYYLEDNDNEFAEYICPECYEKALKLKRTN